MGNISPVVLRKEIGRRLRIARNEAGLNILEAAKRLEIAGSSLSRFENGAGPVTVHLVRSMMDVYDKRLDDVLALVRQARGRGWWRQYGISDKDFIALETGADRISTYELSFVPGLLQTAEYARALFESSINARSQEWIAKRLAVRLTRQERLTDEEHPLALDTVVHEFVLRYPVGGRDVMRTQLQHLALINELPTITLRVLPASAALNEAMYGGFTILDFPTAGQPSIINSTHALGEERQDKSEYVEPARLRFAHLRSLALDPEQSVALIDQVAEECGRAEKKVSTVDLIGARWRKSSFSGGGGDENCVEVALTGPAAAVRDSKNPAGPVLVLPAAGLKALARVAAVARPATDS